MWSLFLVRLFYISVHLPYRLAWNTVAMSRLVPSCYLELLDKLQKRIFRTVGLSFAASIEPLAHRHNEASLSLFCRYYFGRCSSELAQLFPLPYCEEGQVVILIGCIVFLSPFFDVTRMSMSTVSFFAQLDSGILYLQNALICDLKLTGTF